MAIMRRGGVHRRRGEKGASAVEFALVLPVLLAILFGIIEFGFVFNNQISLNQAVREGVRVEALETGDGEQVTRSSFLGVTADAADLQVNVQSCEGDAERATVTATYDHPFLFLPLDGVAQVNSPTLSGQAEMRCGG